MGKKEKVKTSDGISEELRQLSDLYCGNFFFFYPLEALRILSSSIYDLVIKDWMLSQ